MVTRHRLVRPDRRGPATVRLACCPVQGCSMVSSSADSLSGKDNPFQEMMSRV
jgi:hypothetical protein